MRASTQQHKKRRVKTIKEADLPQTVSPRLWAYTVPVPKEQVLQAKAATGRLCGNLDKL